MKTTSPPKWTMGWIVVLVLAVLMISPTESAGAVSAEPALYAGFNSTDARGVIELAGFGQPDVRVTARIKRPESGLIGFCSYRVDGSRSCQTVNPIFSSFDRDDHGCARFVITLTEPVTHAAITDASFVDVIDTAELTPDPPNGIGQLSVCR